MPLLSCNGVYNISYFSKRCLLSIFDVEMGAYNLHILENGGIFRYAIPPLGVRQNEIISKLINVLLVYIAFEFTVSFSMHT